MKFGRPLPWIFAIFGSCLIVCAEAKAESSVSSHAARPDAVISTCHSGLAAPQDFHKEGGFGAVALAPFTLRFWVLPSQGELPKERLIFPRPSLAYLIRTGLSPPVFCA
jgi:hypothetical protein